MSQRTFNGLTSPSLANLDANFAELYAIADYFTTPGYVGASSKFTLDANGDIGFGITPSAWGAGYKAIEMTGVGASFHSFGTGRIGIGQNWYNGASGGVYATTGAIAVYQLVNGQHKFFTAPSGTAGAAATILNNFVVDGTGIYAGSDNNLACGSASLRWSVVYAGTGTINTSDAREKTSVLPLTSAEMAAAKALASEVGTYQWLAAIQAKGTDARTHVGMTVQRAIEIMTAQGLDPMAYGFICHDSWPDSVAEDGSVVPAGDRYAFRPDELLLFIARGLEARISALEAKVG